MKILSTIGFWLLVSLLCAASPLEALDSSQDRDITVDPAIHYYPVTTLGTDSAPALFTVTNTNAGQTRDVISISLDGPPGEDQFVLAADTCSGSVLAANGGSCNFSVRFHPTGRGSKWANIRISTNDAETPTLTAFVANFEDTSSEAMRRMPPVLASLNIQDTMVPGQTYLLTWSIEGYHTGYSSYMVLFDCTGVAADCGANYSDTTRLAESDSVNPVSFTTGNWHFNGVDDQRFDYGWTFQVPEKRNDGSDWASGGTDVVARFYVKDDIDQERDRRSVSLVIPGNLAGQYYDTAGRRIVVRIVP